MTRASVSLANIVEGAHREDSPLSFMMALSATPPKSSLAECLKDGVPGNCYSNPTIWGPPTWFFLHSVTLALPNTVSAEQQTAMRDLLRSITKLLPCASC